MLPAYMEEKDFVGLYLDGCNEASRKGDYKAKVSTLEAVDFFLLSKVKDYMESSKEIRLLITPCTSFPWKMRKQTRDFVPFLVAGKNIMPDDIERFSEAASKVSALKMSKGTELLKFFISKS
jgi:2,3-bisphosphoglycerate-independent phosphoglycerate mutase